MKIINKNGLIEAIAKKSGLSKKGAKESLEATIETIVNFVKKGNKVGLIGFGSFQPAKRKAAIKRNPRTGKEIKVPAKTVFKFKVSKSLNDKMK